MMHYIVINGFESDTLMATGTESKAFIQIG